MTATLIPASGTLLAERPANRLAMQITGRSYVSHSQLSTMRSCPRKFAFVYVEKAEPDFIPSSLIFGGSIHSALELYFRTKLEGLGITHDALLSAYHDSWRRQRDRAGTGVTVRFNKSESDDTLHALADRIFTSFLNSPLAHPKGEILGVEEELRIVLDDELPDVLARVDLVTHTGGALHVVDFKTSRFRWTDEKAQQSGEQLLLYATTVGRMSRHLDVPIKLHFAIITKGKAPVVQVLPVSIDQTRVASMTQSIAQVWDAVKARNFYPSPSPQNCTTCPFKSRCPVFAGK